MNDVENCHNTVKECNFLKLGGGIMGTAKQNRLLKLHCNDTLTYWKRDKFFSGLIHLTSLSEVGVNPEEPHIFFIKAEVENGFRTYEFEDLEKNTENVKEWVYVLEGMI